MWRAGPITSPPHPAARSAMSRSYMLAAPVILVAPPAPGDGADYRPVPGWAKLPDHVTLGPVSAVATDGADRVFVAHRGRHPILVFDRDGKFIRSWGDDQFTTPHGLRVDPAGNVWATDIGNHQVLKFD